jgi:hypothetical protein
MVIVSFSASVVELMTVTAVLLVVNVEDFGNALGPIDPELLELGKQSGGALNGFPIATDKLFATASLFADEFRSLEHRDVLLHPREAHRVLPRERRDRLLLTDRSAKNVSTCRVGERLEHPVDRSVTQLTIYNHMVVDYQQSRCTATSSRNGLADKQVNAPGDSPRAFTCRFRLGYAL